MLCFLNRKKPLNCHYSVPNPRQMSREKSETLCREQARYLVAMLKPTRIFCNSLGAVGADPAACSLAIPQVRCHLLSSSC